eukprot:TRINITY_DN247_c0_g1_i1.p1 TRINITY_DN247_c0_g1~~TRINITY_DN247_c0_g1_i1.p1  ORF type:complete len:696 (-),score=118.34 TRINITY_DN247_c0_g1_i1:90-2177(-)
MQDQSHSPQPELPSERKFEMSLDKKADATSHPRSQQLESKLLRLEQQVDTGDDDFYTSFMRWILADPVVRGSCKLGVADFPQTGRGIVALVDIEPGECILEVPLRLILSSLNHERFTPFLKALFPELTDADVKTVKHPVANPYTLLVLWLMHESHNPNSFWAVYFKVVPLEYNLPITWEQGDLDQLEGCRCYVEASQMRFRLKTMFLDVLVPVMRANPEYFNLSVHTFEVFLWAISTVWSRGFSMDEDKTSCAIVPLADMFNHEPSEPLQEGVDKNRKSNGDGDGDGDGVDGGDTDDTNRVETDEDASRGPNTGKVTRENNRDGDDENPGPTLADDGPANVPSSDSPCCNPPSSSGTKSSLNTGKTSTPDYGYSEKVKRFQVVSNKSYRAGEQVLITYSKSPPELLLQSYGFFILDKESDYGKRCDVVWVDNVNDDANDDDGNDDDANDGDGNDDDDDDDDGEVVGGFFFQLPFDPRENWEDNELLRSRKREVMERHKVFTPPELLILTTRGRTPHELMTAMRIYVAEDDDTVAALDRSLAASRFGPVSLANELRAYALALALVGHMLDGYPTCVKYDSCLLRRMVVTDDVRLHTVLPDVGGCGCGVGCVGSRCDGGEAVTCGDHFNSRSGGGIVGVAPLSFEDLPPVHCSTNTYTAVRLRLAEKRYLFEMHRTFSFSVGLLSERRAEFGTGFLV